ncbi:MAG TPA: DUF4270 family protein [Hanamia sp.]
MLKNQNKSAVTGILLLFSIAFGCTKIDATSLGNHLIPAVDNIHTFDTTFSIIANNFDEIECDSNHRGNLQALGLISNDPLFGGTNAKIYVEFKPSSFPFNFPVADPNSYEIDSAVIVLNYSHSFGDTNTLQKVNIYQLSDTFDVTKNYNTCNVLGYDNSMLLGQKEYYPKYLIDSIHAYQEESNSQLRIPLSKVFIQKLITDSAKIFQSESAFVNYFKGFAIVPDTLAGGQALNYFDISTSRMSIYLRYKSSETADTTVINFAFNGYSGLSNSITRNRDNAEMLKYLSHSPQGDSLLYIQTSPGNYALLTIPGLSGLSNRVINRAEIIVDQEYSAMTLNDLFAPPINLYVETKDVSINDSAFIPIPCDFNSSELQNNFQNLGGQLKYVTNGAGQSIGEYHFNISRYVQSIVTQGKKNLTLKLSAPDYVTNTSTYVDYCRQGIGPFSTPRNNTAEGRVQLNGTNNTPNRIRLHVIYSVL